MSQKNTESKTMQRAGASGRWRQPVVAAALVVVLTLTTRLEAQVTSATAKGERAPAAIVRPQAATAARQLKDQVVARLEGMSARRGWNFPVLDVVRRMSPEQVLQMVTARQSSAASRTGISAPDRGLDVADCLLLPQNGLLNPAFENFVFNNLFVRGGEGAERGHENFAGHRPAFYDWDGDGDLDAFVGIPSTGVKRTTGASLVEEDQSDRSFITGEPGTILYFENVTGESSSPFPPDVPYFVPDYSSDSPVSFLGLIGNPAPAIADLDGNDVPELYVGDGDGKVRVYELIPDRGEPQFDGDFTYLQVVSPEVPMRGVLVDLDVGLDATPAFFNVDGDPEGELELFVGRDVLDIRGPGEDSEPIYLFSRAASTDRGGLPFVWDKAEPENNPFTDADMPFGTAPAFADIDGDGDVEVFVGTKYAVHFFENLGLSAQTGTIFEQRYGLENPLAGRVTLFDENGPAFADLDGDGDLDAFFGGKTSVAFVENRGTNLDAAFLDMGISPEYADLDGDGDLDVLASGLTFVESLVDPRAGDDVAAPEVQPFLVYFENVGTSEEPVWERRLDEDGFVSPVAYLDIDSPFVFADLIDIDGDGDLDLFVGDKDEMRFFLNIGTPMAPEFEEQFGTDNSLSPFNGPVPRGPEPDYLGLVDPFFADIDGDGDFDLLAFQVNDYEMRYFRNDDIEGGDVVLDGAVFVELTGGPDDPFASVVPGAPWLADIDHDGDLDLFIAASEFFGDRGRGLFLGGVVQYTNEGDATTPMFSEGELAFWLAEFPDATRGEVADDFPGPLFPYVFASPAVVDIDADGDLDGFLGFFGGNEAFIAPGGLVVTPDSVTTTELGGEDTITVVMKSAPFGEVMFAVSVDDGTEATVLPTSLTFTPENWDEPQELTVTGVDDALLDGDQPFQVTISPAPVFRGAEPGNCVEDVVVDGINIDNESLMADLVASKTVSGNFTVGGTVTYVVTLTNTGAGTQLDNMGPEFVDMMPTGVVLQTVMASSGTAEIQGNDVVFNGSIPPGGSVTITATALVVGLPGDSVINQGTVSYDGDGSGDNDQQVVTDDPTVGGVEDPTVFRVRTVLEIPTLSAVGRWAMGGLLALFAFVGIRSRR